MYDIERYLEARDVADAIRALDADKQAIVISGGSDVLIKIREGKLAGCSLVSIHGLKELEGVRMEPDGAIAIGPVTSFTHLAENPLIKAHLPVLAHAVDQVGGPQIRNIGTIGGNICNGVTSADSASTLFALNAVLELTGAGGKRQVPIAEFYKGPGKTIREHGELMTAIRIARADYEGFGGHYIKYAQRRAMDIATLGCAALVKLTPERDAVSELRLAFGVAAPTPIRCGKTEAAAKGQKLTPELLDLIGRMAQSETNPRTSWRATREFRLSLAEELSRRVVRQAIINAGGVLDA